MNYDLTRAFLGFSQLTVAWLTWKGDVGYLFGCFILMVASGVFNLAPAFPTDEMWKHWVQVPSYAVLLALTIAASVEVFAFTRRRTYPRERWMMLAASLALGGAVVVAGWVWEPETWYQAFMIGRQYVLILLTVGYSAAWVWVTCGRPVHIEAQIETHGTFWCVWLMAAALLSSTTKGGLWWQFFAWDGGQEIWRLTSGALMLAQIWLCVGMGINLRRWRGAVRIRAV